MNSIPRVSPAIERVPDPLEQRLEKIEACLESMDDEVIPVGVATLLALLRQPERLGVSLAQGVVKKGEALTPLESGEREVGALRVNIAQAGRPVKQAEAEGTYRDDFSAEANVSTQERKRGGFAGQPRDGLAARPREASVEGQVFVTGTDDAASSVLPPVMNIDTDRSRSVFEDIFAQVEPRGVEELSLNPLLARSDSLVSLAPTLFESEAGEQASTPESHEDASADPRDNDDDDTAQHFLQVPFINERAHGKVVITRPSAESSEWLIRASDRQVFDQLQANFDQPRQSRWRLDERPEPFAQNDGVR